MEKASHGGRGAVIQSVIGSVAAVIVTLALILLAALLIKWAELSDAWLMPVNQVIKALSIFAGCMTGIKQSGMGWLKGLVIGVVYSVLALLIFSLVNMTLTIDLSTLWDILFGAAAGVICGVITVNIKR